MILMELVDLVLLLNFEDDIDMTNVLNIMINLNKKTAMNSSLIDLLYCQ